MRGRWRRHGSFRGAKWAFFLRNHDELDLGNLSEEERQAVFAELAPEPSMQLYGRGIRRRLAPMLGDRRRLELAYSLLLSLPGTPVLRYGEEIGMGENLRLKERSGPHTPMQWTSGPNAARRQSGPCGPPDDGLYGPAKVNVEQQRRDSGSLL